MSSAHPAIAELEATINQLRVTDSELRGSIAAVLRAFLETYQTSEHPPDCLHHAGGFCYGHQRQLIHLGCGQQVQSCPCLEPYQNLAYWATA